jgi:thiol-disulfide isomerase/thioredoxin
MRTRNGIAQLAALAVVAAGALGCEAEATVDDAPKGLTAQGVLSADIDNGTFTVDYANKTATALVKHKINPEVGGYACIPEVSLHIEGGEHNACDLHLDFKADFDGVLKLDRARFWAKGAIFQDDVAIQTFDCPGWTKEPAKGEVVYEGSSSDVELSMVPIAYPQAAKEAAVAHDVLLNPKGKLTMTYKGRHFELNLDPIKFEGDLVSEGSTDLACAQTWQPLPQFELTDINPKSPKAGQTYGLDAFKGKYVAVLMGAGWCASCISQVEYMEKIKKDLEGKGRNDFVMVAINDVSATSPSDQKNICGKQGQATFPIFQGTGTYGWKSFTDPTNGLAAVKNDCFIYAPDGRFVFKHVGKATVNMTQFETELRAALEMTPE